MPQPESSQPRAREFRVLTERGGGLGNAHGPSSRCVSHTGSLSSHPGCQNGWVTSTEVLMRQVVGQAVRPHSSGQMVPSAGSPGLGGPSRCGRHCDCHQERPASPALGLLSSVVLQALALERGKAEPECQGGKDLRLQGLPSHLSGHWWWLCEAKLRPLLPPPHLMQTSSPPFPP